MITKKILDKCRSLELQFTSHMALLIVNQTTKTTTIHTFIDDIMLKVTQNTINCTDKTKNKTTEFINNQQYFHKILEQLAHSFFNFLHVFHKKINFLNMNLISLLNKQLTKLEKQDISTPGFWSRV